MTPSSARAFIAVGDSARVAREARPRRDPRDPGDEGARRGDHRAQGHRRPRAEAGPRRHPRHRVRGAAAPARARTRGPLGPLAHHPRRAARARRRWLRRARRRRSASTAPTGSSAPSSTASSSTTSSRPTSSPPTCTARIRLARVLGYRDSPERTALRTVRGRAPGPPARRAQHPRAPLLRAAARDARRDRARCRPEAAEERLAAFGFTDVERTRAAVRELAVGLTRRSRVMRELLPVILGWLSETPDPDLGLLQLRRLAEGPARSASLATTFRDAPGCRRADLPPPRLEPRGGRRAAPPPRVRRRPRRRRRARASRRHAPSCVADAFDTLEWRGDEEQRREGLRRFKRRELLRIATRDLLGYARLEATERELTGAGRGVPRSRARVAAARRCRSRSSGMGRLGGGELSYASDIDVMFVYDGESADRLRRTPSRSRRAWCRRSARPPPRARRSASTPASDPRATRDRSRGRSAGSAEYYDAVGTDLGAAGAHQGALRRRRRRARRALLRARRRSSSTGGR